MNSLSLRSLLPETLWLEPEHFAQARQQSDAILNESELNESDQWQAYLQTLAQLSFQDWLKEKLPDAHLSHIESPSPAISYLELNGFKLCVVATEHVLDDTVRIPRLAVDRPELCAHYYALIEVLEDQQEAVMRGFLRYDELTAQLNAINLTPLYESSTHYHLPLSSLDSEPNRLVSYIQQLLPGAIALPTAAPEPSSTTQSTANQANTPVTTAITTRLGQWLEGSLTQGWQAVDSLINPRLTLAYATRSGSSEMRAGKRINLGVQLVECEVILLITVTPEADEKRGVQVQVLPAGDRQVLPAQLKVSLVSAKNKVLQEVTAREQDNLIQLKPFRGKLGVHFSVELSLNDLQVSEHFEL